MQAIRKDGSLLDLEIRAGDIYRGGELVGRQGIARNITELKRLQAEVADKSQRLTLLEEQTRAAMDLYRRIAELTMDAPADPPGKERALRSVQRSLALATAEKLGLGARTSRTRAACRGLLESGDRGAGPPQPEHGQGSCQQADARVVVKRLLPLAELGGRHRPAGSGHTRPRPLRRWACGAARTRRRAARAGRAGPPPSLAADALEPRRGRGRRSGPLPVASYMPYSGQTPPAGITSQIALSPGPAALPLEGKIALLELADAPLNTAVFDALDYGAPEHPSGSNSSGPNVPAPYDRPWISALQIPSEMQALQAAGAAAAIFVLDLPAEAADGSYFPYDGVIRDLPALYVDRNVGAKLKQVAPRAGRFDSG